MAEKPTTMVLNVVDLQCSKCYKKVKKLLCKFPEIRDQTYDEKENKVTIKVVCCSPEKIRDKLCCKGGGCIKSIEIKEPPPPPLPPPPPKKISIDLELALQLQRGLGGQCSCGGHSSSCGRDPSSCGGHSSSCGGHPSSCGGHSSSCGGHPSSCGGHPSSCGRDPSSCSGQVQCYQCYGRPVYDSWNGYGSGCVYYTEENPKGCLTM